MARLRVVGGDGVEQVVDVGDARLQIGRGRDNDIVLPDPQKGVSRAHAELRFENGHYVIVDLQSQNGTWINGRRVERSDVPFGAEVAIGAYRLTLLNDRVASPAVAPRASAPDPLDDMRLTERYEPPLLPAQPTARKAGTPRWVIGSAAGLIAVVGLAAVVWVSGSRPGDAASDPVPAPSSDRPVADGSAPPSQAPPEPSAPTERAGEPVDLPNESPSKRAAVAMPVNPPSVTEGSRTSRRPGESTEAWRSRTAALQTRYGYSKAALDRGDFAAAAGGFEAILLEEPGFLDAPRLLVQAQSGLRASARSLFEAGKKLDAAGDWMGALQKYEQARQVHAGLPGLADSLQRVRGMLHAAGAAAFKQARQHEGSGRIQDAVREYEKAAQWLPPDDPNRQVAVAKIEQLRKKD